ncbi:MULTISPECIES: ATP-binding protein [Nocardia]|uniref:ATPase AAA n=1 Tax=Nocardia sputorum TaxID=2984338 RepID=A0ABM8D141_9NOCA|nr:ATP-binding protein [Nocardia sputorum]BDU01043.1 ATPase AAA [Nocardia sputorum]
MTVSGLVESLRRLDALLTRAVDAAAEVFGSDAAADPYRGLVIRPEEVARLLRRSPGQPVLSGGAIVTDAHSEVCEWLANAFDLTAFDLDLLLIAAAPEIDLRYERLFGYLQDDVSRRRASVDLALHLLCADAAERIAARARVAPDAPLVHHGLLHLVVDPARPQQPLLAQEMLVDGQVLRLLLSESTLDPRLVGRAFLGEPGRPRAELPLDDCTLDALPTADVMRTGGDPPPRLFFCGPGGVGQLAAAEALAAEAGRRLLVVDLERASGEERPVEELLRIAFREAWFRGTGIFLGGVDAVPAAAAGRLRAALTKEVACSRVLTVLSGEEVWIPASTRGELAAGVVAVPFPVPSAPSRARCWRATVEAAGMAVDEWAVQALASRFRLTDAHIREVVASAVHRGAWMGALPASDDLFAAARARSGRELGTLTRKIDHVYGWDDLVLPADTKAQLGEVASRVAHRRRVLDDWGFHRLLASGRGICALFAGPSGTGKTMAADVVAGELGLDLYVIDLATVVSKYIGETERNLKRIFDAATTADAVLFFDEADAIFGKRSEVRDAHDRYANVEIAYLLQKIEEYDGIAILATNLRENLDAAFLRRLQFVIDFPVPDEADRERMWRRFIPAQAPVDDAIDYPFLARQFRLPGGNIKNIVVSAAYLASANSGRIDMGHVMRAARREHQKIGRVLSDSDAGAYADILGREG